MTRLRTEFGIYGVDTGRLIFAPRVSPDICRTNSDLLSEFLEEDAIQVAIDDSIDLLGNNISFVSISQIVAWIPTCFYEKHFDFQACDNSHHGRGPPLKLNIWL